MLSLDTLAPEILQLVFYAVQSLDPGPRYVLDAPKECPYPEGHGESRPGHEKHGRWILSNPGPLFLAATCYRFRDVYLSRYISSNLILTIPDVPQERPYMSEGEHPYAFWHDSGMNGNLLLQLRRMKATARGKPLTRFMLDFQWNTAFRYRTNPRELCFRMWKEILGSVSEVFGDELMVVICTQGEAVEQDFRRHAPKRIRLLEDFGRNVRGLPQDLLVPVVAAPAADPGSLRPLRSGSVAVLRSPRNAPAPKGDLTVAAPLSMHIYFGYGEVEADFPMSHALLAFASKNLRSFYFSSDPNNMRLVGHSRRPAEGKNLYMLKNEFSYASPWRFLLPSYSSAWKTLEDITLDCSLFWSEFAYTLPHLSQLKTLDCGLAILFTEPTFPFKIETRESARQRIIQTCELRDDVTQKERGLKKNKEKHWLKIEKERILCPRIEPLERETTARPGGNNAMHSRFHTVDVKTCVEVGRRRFARSRRR